MSCKETHYTKKKSIFGGGVQCVLPKPAFKLWKPFMRKNGTRNAAWPNHFFFFQIMARVTKSKRIFAVTHISRHNTCRKAKESTACIKRKAGWNHYCHSRCFLSTVLWGMQCSMPKSSTVSSKDTCNHCTKL